ncbi:hypothetical protein ACTMU2_16960 [Cupriavidus basilensis]
MAAQSSQLYATNIRHLLTELTPGKDGELVVNMDDEMIRGRHRKAYQGDVTWPPPPLKTAPPPAPAADARAGRSRGATEPHRHDADRAGHRRRRTAGHGRGGAARVHGAFHGVRAGHFRRLPGGWCGT